MAQRRTIQESCSTKHAKTCLTKSVLSGETWFLLERPAQRRAKQEAYSAPHAKALHDNECFVDGNDGPAQQRTTQETCSAPRAKALHVRLC